MQQDIIEPTIFADARPTGPTIRINPAARRWVLRLKAVSPVSHHDPAQADKSNVSLFRRQAQLVDTGSAGRLPTQDELDRVLNLLPVPVEIADLFAEVTIEEFIATALVREFIHAYSSVDGEGLFSGMERYRRLEERLAQSATTQDTLFRFWGTLCRSLQVGSAGTHESEVLMRMLALPATLGSSVLRTLAHTPRPVVMLARLWEDHSKMMSEKYAEAAGREVLSGETTVIARRADALRKGADVAVLQVPAVSANTVRHQAVREPGMQHLFDRLGLGFDEPSPATVATFYNGGDIKAGAHPPANVFWMRKTIRSQFPLLALISGATDAYILGEGNLHLFAWLRSSENNAALSRFGLETDLSAFSLLDEEVLTRHAGRVETGQMPFGFETLIAGTEIVVEFSLTPYASDLEAGALMAALDWWMRHGAKLGGQSARGYGLFNAEWHDCELDEESLHQYEDYLVKNHDRLRASIVDGTLGAGGVAP